MADVQGEVTRLLEAIRAGDESARGRLVELIYTELHGMAAALMAQERVGHTLQPTALVHEALARLFRSDVLVRAPNRAYLFGAAAQAMRRVLVEHARKRAAHQRAEAQWVQRLPFDDVLDDFARQRMDVLALDESLHHLARLHERQSQVITLRFFGGFTLPEIADQLGVSLSTIESDFRIARAWLREQLQGRA